MLGVSVANANQSIATHPEAVLGDNVIEELTAGRVLHHDKVPVLGLDHLIESRDVGMLEFLQGLDLEGRARQVVL